MLPALFAYFLLILGTTASAAPTAPAGWLALEALPPNVATFAHAFDPRPQKSFVSIQKIERSAEIDKLEVKLKAAATSSEKISVSGYEILSVEPDGGCWRLNLRATAKEGPARQTWCFHPGNAMVAIEEGPFRIGDAFVHDLLNEPGKKP